MAVKIVRYEPTPNPNALKCWLSAPLTQVPRSFLNASMAAEDPIAARLFAEAGLTNVYMNGDWMTISKPPSAGWPAVKSTVEAILGASDGAE